MYEHAGPISGDAKRYAPGFPVREDTMTVHILRSRVDRLEELRANLSHAKALRELIPGSFAVDELALAPNVDRSFRADWQGTKTNNEVN